MLRLSIRDFPLAIDPAVGRLEVKHKIPAPPLPGAAGEHVWTTLYRIPPEAVAAVIPAVQADLPHIFGNNRDLAVCAYLVLYTPAGGLSSVAYNRGNGDWVMLDCPEELTGRPTLLPSVRLLFHDEQRRSDYLEQLRETPPAGMVGDPRIVEVFADVD